MGANRSAEANTVRRLEVPVIVRLGTRRLTMREAVELMPGTILELPKNAEEELELMVNNQQIGRGVAVKVGENFGVRITGIGSGEQAGSPGGSPQDPSMDEVEVAERLLADQL